MEENDILIPCSAETKQGREEIWQAMDNLTGWVEPVKEQPKEPKKDRKKYRKKA